MIARMAELVWVPLFIDDLDADFARFYRADWETLSGPRFMTRAQRVPLYGGVVAQRFARYRRPVAQVDDTLPALPAGAQHADQSDLIEG